jgi:hypothetical protein
MEQKQEKDLASRIVDMLGAMLDKELVRTIHPEDRVYFNGQYCGISMAYYDAKRMLNEEKQKTKGEN